LFYAGILTYRGSGATIREAGLLYIPELLPVFFLATQTDFKYKEL